jgi:hypothetical protein
MSTIDFFVKAPAIADMPVGTFAEALDGIDRRRPIATAIRNRAHDGDLRAIEGMRRLDIALAELRIPLIQLADTMAAAVDIIDGGIPDESFWSQEISKRRRTLLR